ERLCVVVHEWEIDAQAGIVPGIRDGEAVGWKRTAGRVRQIQERSDACCDSGRRVEPHITQESSANDQAEQARHEPRRREITHHCCVLLKLCRQNKWYATVLSVI